MQYYIQATDGANIVESEVYEIKVNDAKAQDTPSDGVQDTKEKKSGFSGLLLGAILSVSVIIIIMLIIVFFVTRYRKRSSDEIKSVPVQRQLRKLKIQKYKLSSDKCNGEICEEHLKVIDEDKVELKE